jgi:hypothetical protein
MTAYVTSRRLCSRQRRSFDRIIFTTEANSIIRMSLLKSSSSLHK